MALLGLHYSKSFKENLLNKKITGGVLAGEWKMPVGSKMFLYVSESDNVKNSGKEIKLGTVKVNECYTKKVGELNDEEARGEAFKDKKELIDAAKYWHKLDLEDIITYIKFELI